MAGALATTGVALPFVHGLGEGEANGLRGMVAKLGLYRDPLQIAAWRYLHAQRWLGCR